MSTIGKKTPAQVQQLVAQVRQQVEAGTLPDAELQKTVQQAIHIVAAEVEADHYVETLGSAHVEAALQPTLAQAHKDLAAAIEKKNASWFGLGGFLPEDGEKAVAWEPVRTKRAELESTVVAPAANEVMADQKALSELNGLAQLAKAPKDVRDSLALLGNTKLWSDSRAIYSDTAKALVVLTGALGGEAKATAALDFQRTAANWSLPDGKKLTWTDDAKALVALAHAIGGEEKATAAMKFQHMTAVWGPGGIMPNGWNDTAKAAVALAHVIGGEDKTKAAFAFQQEHAAWKMFSGPKSPWPDSTKAVVLLAHVLGGETNAQASVAFHEKRAVWGTPPVSTPWSVPAKSVVMLARSISDESRAGAAINFQEKNARWRSGTASTPWDDIAKSIVTLGHVVGGEEKMKAAMVFQEARGKFPIGSSFGDRAKSLLAFAHMIGGEERASAAMDFMNQATVNQAVWGDISRAQLVLATVLGSTPDSELPMSRQSLAAIVGATAGMLNQVAAEEAAAKAKAEEEENE